MKIVIPWTAQEDIVGPVAYDAAAGVYHHFCDKCRQVESFPLANVEVMEDGVTVAFRCPRTRKLPNGTLEQTGHFINTAHADEMDALGRTGVHVEPIRALKKALQAKGVIK